MNYVFVYGTLMKNERNHYLLNDSEFIGNGNIKNYFMLDMDRIVLMNYIFMYKY